MSDLLFLLAMSISGLLALLGLFSWAILLCRWGSPVFAADWEALERALGQSLERRSVPALPRTDPALNWRHIEVDMPTQDVSYEDDWDDVVAVRKKKKKRLKAHRKNPNYAVLPGLQDDVFTEDLRSTEMQTVEDEEDEEEEEEKPIVKMKKKKLRVHPKNPPVSDEGEEGIVVKKKKKKLRVHPKNPQYDTLRGVKDDMFAENEEADAVVVRKKKKKKLRVHPKNPQYDTLRGVQDNIFAEDEEKDARSASPGTTLVTHTTEVTRGTNRTNVYPSDDDDDD